MLDASKWFVVAVGLVHVAVQASGRGRGESVELARHGRLRQLVRRFSCLHAHVNRGVGVGAGGGGRDQQQSGMTHRLQAIFHGHLIIFK